MASSGDAQVSGRSWQAPGLGTCNPAHHAAPLAPTVPVPPERASPAASAVHIPQPDSQPAARREPGPAESEPEARACGAEQAQPEAGGREPPLTLAHSRMQSRQK